MLFELNLQKPPEQLVFWNENEKGGLGQNSLFGSSCADVGIITRKLFKLQTDSEFSTFWLQNLEGFNVIVRILKLSKDYHILQETMLERKPIFYDTSWRSLAYKHFLAEQDLRDLCSREFIFGVQSSLVYIHYPLFAL